MIFPTTEKYFSRNPYFNLLRKLREELMGTIKDKEHILVIGYSFRDPAINNAFYDAFKNIKRALFFDFNEDVVGTLNLRIESLGVKNAKAT